MAAGAKTPQSENLAHLGTNAKAGALMVTYAPDLSPVPFTTTAHQTCDKNLVR
jgi:hypothetical protein